MGKAVITLITAIMLTLGLAGCKAPESTAEETPSEKDPPENTSEKEENDSEVVRIAEKIKSAYGENYVPDAEVPEDMIAAVYGVEAELYDEIFAEGSNSRPDVLIVARAASGKAGDLKAALEAYKSRLRSGAGEDSAKINACRIVQNGDHIALILLGKSGGEDLSEEEAERFAKEQSDIGAEAFKEFFRR